MHRVSSESGRTSGLDAIDSGAGGNIGYKAGRQGNILILEEERKETLAARQNRRIQAFNETLEYFGRHEHTRINIPKQPTRTSTINPLRTHDAPGRHLPKRSQRHPHAYKLHDKKLRGRIKHRYKKLRSIRHKRRTQQLSLIIYFILLPPDMAYIISYLLFMATMIRRLTDTSTKNFVAECFPANVMRAQEGERLPIRWNRPGRQPERVPLRIGESDHVGASVKR